MKRNGPSLLSASIVTLPMMIGAHASAASFERDSSTPMFVSGDKLRGMDVRNTRDEALGEITDVIIDRGSGRIPWVVLKSGATLGIGGKHVVVPWESFSWDQADKKATLNTTAEQIKTWPEFNADRWKASGRDSDMLPRTLAREYYKDIPGGAATWPTDSDSSGARVKGKIVKISRYPMHANGEDIVVTVLTDDNRTEEVILGPSWFLSGNSVVLYRDAPADFRVVRMQRDGKPVVVARGMVIDSRDTTFYSDQGVPVWAYDNPANRTTSTIDPFVLSKEVDGKQVECRGVKCGKVNDLVIETNSGRVAFLSIDPDQNVLGIGDTKRLVPFTIATVVAGDRVFIDASKAMVTNSPATPSDLKNLTDDKLYGSVYRSYDVATPMFETRKR